MTTFRMDHLHVICEDLEGMVHFLTKGVGATFQENRVFGGADGAIIKLDRLQINLRVPKEAETGIQKNIPSLGYDHLGLTVDDLNSACSRLAEFGCTIDSGPTELNDRKIVFLKGPENITLELMEMF